MGVNININKEHRVSEKGGRVRERRCKWDKKRRVIYIKR